jgi:hypothetical protein
MFGLRMGVLSFKRVRAFCKDKNQTLFFFQNQTLTFEIASFCIQSSNFPVKEKK